MRQISLNLLRKMKITEHPNEDSMPPDEDSDFGMLIDPSKYVPFDDKIKLVELMKNCSREILTNVVQLIRAESHSE